MSDQKKYKKISKTKFEEILVEKFEDLSARPYTENHFDEGRIKMTLYYSNGEHIGTHCPKGSTWHKNV